MINYLELKGVMMPYVCQNCGFSSEERIEECPDCGGLVEEEEPQIDWLGEEGEEKNPGKVEIKQNKKKEK